GQLDAHGSAAYPIIFTSIADDSEMGDTNGDGPTTTPAPGQYGQAIEIGAMTDKDIASNTPRSIISNTAFLYAGKSDGQAGGCLFASPVVGVDKWGRAELTHDDFAQFTCNALSSGNMAADGIGSMTVRNSFFEVSIGGDALSEFYGGVVKDNVFANVSNIHDYFNNGYSISVTGNYFAGKIL